jgi:hypothetical protein
MKKLILIFLLAASLPCDAKFKFYNSQNKKSNIVWMGGSLATGATCNALMDATNDHFASSIFKNQDPKFWNHQISWQYAPNVLGYHVDAWHLAKTTMVASLCVPFAVVMHENLPIVKKHPFIDKTIWWAITGISWNLVFNTNYNHLFK